MNTVVAHARSSFARRAGVLAEAIRAGWSGQQERCGSARFRVAAEIEGLLVGGAHRDVLRIFCRPVPFAARKVTRKTVVATSATIASSIGVR
jgi:hypothetical protein